MNKIELTIITPCFNEEKNILDCAKSVSDIMRDTLPNVNYEHIFIDNNSEDDTAQILGDLCIQDSHIKLLVNSRNVGAFVSIYKALQEASGLAIIPMYAADMQDPAEVIPTFYNKWLEGYLTIFGVRKNRNENFIMTKIRLLYYRIIQKFSESYIPINAGEFLLADKKVIDSIIATKDFEPYIRGMVAAAGVKSIEIEYSMNKRSKGKSSTNLVKLFDIAINAFISTTRIPARLILMLGFFISSLSLVIVLIKILNYSILSIGWIRDISINTTLLLLIGGFQIFFIGLIGEYILSIHAQVRRVPESFFTKKINFE